MTLARKQIYFINLTLFICVLCFSAFFVSRLTPDMEYVVPGHKNDFDTHTADIKSSYYRAHRDEIDLIFIGSSFTASAVSEEVIEGILPDLNAINIARRGADPTETFQQFRSLFSSDSAGKIVVMEHAHQHTFTPRRRTPAKYRIGQLAKKTVEVWRSDRDFLAKLNLSRGAVRKFLIDHQIIHGWWAPRLLIMTATDYSGWEPNVVGHPETLPAEKDFPFRQPLEFEKEIIQQEVDLARKQNLTLIYLLTPRGKVRSIDPRDSLPEELNKGYYVLDFDRPDEYPDFRDPRMFGDHEHLSREGAVRFCELLGEALKDLLERGPIGNPS